MKMSGAGDRYLDDKLEEALRRTATPLPPPQEGVCKAHPVLHQAVDDVRDASHVLLLCRQEDRKLGNHVPVSPQKSCKIGPFAFKGFDAADILKIGGILIIGLMLVGDKVKNWIYPLAQEATVTENRDLTEQQLTRMETTAARVAQGVAQKLIDRTIEERERDRLRK